jgi:hypothetical protein
VFRVSRRFALLGAATLLIAVFGLGRPAASAAPLPPSPEAQVSGQLTAGWIARQIEAVDGLVPSAWTPGAVDYTNTAYAILALSAAEVGQDAITTAGSALWDSGSTYIGEPEALADSWSAVAITALGLDVAGLDATQFPGPAGARDLFAELASVVAADGTPGPVASATAYGASFAVLALARSSAGVPPVLVDWLAAQPCTDSTSPTYGAFGFVPGGCESGDADSTALSIQALLAAGRPASDPIVTAAAAWLEAQQDAVGGWGTPGFTPINANTTGLVTQALRALGSPAVADAETFLLGLTLGCAAVDPADPTSPANAGAMAYSADDGAPDPTAADETTIASLLSASVQGLLGLGGGPIGTLDGTVASVGVPTGQICQAAGETPATELPAAPADTPAEAPADSNDSNSSVGWWIGGGAAAVLLIGVIIGALLARRRSTSA